MSSLNRVILIGRLVRDPELRTTNTGKSVVEFSIAVDKRFKPQDPSQPTADFFRCKAWDKTAEFVSNYLSKGRLAAVEGRIETRKFVDKEGNNREIFEIVADSVQGLDRPRDDAPGNAGGGQSYGGGGGRPAGGAAPSPDEYDPFADE
ncbi:single-stranded DNA-binding protein [Fimbriimonas ginsengisoli]|uniref:Single-stranded DNA-binding protein n=1 Tax=Fimbriimonas ginsengisoli Gsoil 348 TaxID=661478 RepID=A0A068NVF8_FIMGI|nr:single-stranded DNA-binding protein [Fimbriimonas ginsengisoli]AIE85539.1 single-strand binding protein [Fimbriimonas ginsengisoli Gsoil 348]